MSATVTPLRAPLPLQDGLELVWQIRRLWRERAIDPFAADLKLQPMRCHPNVRLAALAAETTADIVAAWHRGGCQPFDISGEVIR